MVSLLICMKHCSTYHLEHPLGSLYECSLGRVLNINEHHPHSGPNCFQTTTSTHVIHPLAEALTRIFEGISSCCKTSGGTLPLAPLETISTGFFILLAMAQSATVKPCSVTPVVAMQMDLALCHGGMSNMYIVWSI